MLAIGRTTLYELIKAGALRPIRIGRCVRFSTADLERFVANGCVTPAIEQLPPDHGRPKPSSRRPSRDIDAPNLFDAAG
jgi:excisionase family DNA binding protein